MEYHHRREMPDCSNLANLLIESTLCDFTGTIYGVLRTYDVPKFLN